MRHHLENKFLRISVHETGAELCSIFNKKTETEHIWQANPEIWASHAPNLFPVIGTIKDTFKLIDGIKYAIPRHGFVRHNRDIRLKEKSENQLVFELLYSEKTLQVYPYKFSFRIAFTLRGKTVEVSHQVINLDEKTLYFSLGGHPAFNIQLKNGEKIEDYYLEFDRSLQLETFLLNEDGLVTSKTKKILNDKKRLHLTPDIFNHDALIFRDIQSKKVALCSQDSGKILSVAYGDFKNLGIWAKPGAPYVCIEPWMGIADTENCSENFEEKEDIQKLETGKQANFVYSIEIY